MKTKKLLGSILLGALLGVALMVPATAKASIEPDLVPDDTEDALCEQMSDDTGGILSCGEDYYDITTFTEYQGEFEAPDSAGYDEGLTKATSAREFILNITNFALSFLGLIAVIIIIYGGFLYVTAGGKDEQMEKGKKSVMYAIIGIIVVLSSYAVVNTLIGEAAGGGEDRGGGGIYSSGDSVTGEDVDIYNVNIIADELQSIAAEYVEVFTTYSNVNAYLSYAEDYPMPQLEEVSSALDFILRDEYVPYEDDSIHRLEEHARTMNEVASEIIQLVDRYSDTYSTASDMEVYTELTIDAINSYYQYNVDSISYIPVAHAYYDGGELQDYYDNIGDMLVEIENTAMADFNEYVDGYYERMDILKAPFELEGISTTLSIINDQFGVVLGYFTPGTMVSTTVTMPLFGLTSLTYTYSSLEGGGAAKQQIANEFVDNSALRDVVNELGELFALVENLEFVTAVITASTSEASEPAVISFDGLSSYDPSDISIGDTQYHWDLDGDGEYDAEGATVSYTYEDTGTYRVGLTVTSNDDNIAPGQSYISITVHPPESQIVLTAKTAGKGDIIKLADYEEGVSRSRAKFSLVEGSGGLTMDMTGTVDGNGDDTVYHKLDCGNGEEFESASLLTETVCTYTAEGLYTLSVEVTDVIGNTDRYIGEIIIASPAARIIPSTFAVDANSILSLDGSSSTTDTGTIVGFDWSWTLDGEEGDIDGEGDADHTFTHPGIYEVSLKVTDSAGGQDTDSIEITVESQPPVAKFTYDIPDPAQPGIVHFDAGSSYDPDPEDIISYLWTFEGTEGNDYEFMGETNAESEEPMVKFKETGQKNLILGVSDQYEDEDLKQTTTLEGTFTVESVLDVALDVPNGVAYQLEEEGEVDVSFAVTSEHAEVFEIEYGDGDYDVEDNLISNTATFSHTYVEAGVYIVEVTVYDEDGSENSYEKKVYIGESDTPIAVISIKKDGVTKNALDISGNINTVFTFDASDSQNTNGTAINLDYSWNLGDNTQSTEKKMTHTYDEVGTFDVTLTVSDEDDPTASSTDTFRIEIAEEPPVINALSYQVLSDSYTTPVQLSLQVDAEDPDGQIINYYWYYYDVTNTTEKLGAQITTDNIVNITIPTRGTSGEEKEYAFVVEITDTGNNTVSSADIFDESEVPTIEVVNGENEAPVAEFSVSDTLIMLGDSVKLSSSSYDPDGDDLVYVWDLESDGFSNNEPTSLSTITVTPEEAGCFDVRLKVIDSNEQATVAPDTVEICVESIANPPDAAFVYTVDYLTVDFENNSTVDEVNGAELYATYWDFDTNTDSNGNGDPEDDIDSEEENPSFTYDDIGNYSVKLTVYDTAGGNDEVVHTITIAETDPPTAAFTYQINDLTVGFQSNSQPAEEGIEIVSYIWDFDIAVDSDGDGDAVNDEESFEEDPIFEYNDYGTYTVKLSILDSMNKADYVTRTVEVTADEELIGYMLTNPPVSQGDGSIHLEGESGYIDVEYSTNRESGEGITCWLDKNVYFDTDGDGVPDNDHDHEDTACVSGTFAGVNFERSWADPWGLVMMLTVEDEYENIYQVTAPIVFDDPELGGANLFPVSGTQGFTLMMIAISFALLGASIYTVKRIN